MISVFRRQVLGHLQCDARCHNPIGTGLNRGRGIGIDHHLALRVGIAEGCKLVRGTTKVEEQVASRSGINTRLPGVSIFAVSPMNLTPATTRVSAG